MKNNRTRIAFDQRVYDIESIKRALYDMNLVGEICISKENQIIVKFRANNGYFSDETISNFRDAVLQNQIRIETERDYGIIRKIILAQAFFPCDNLDEILSHILNENEL